jgi:hypothetical protein
MTGWYYSDSARNPGGVDDEGDPASLDLSPFGIVAPGEVVIVTEEIEQDFRDIWFNMPATVKIIGENGINLGRDDEINIYSGTDPIANLIDSLWYGDNPSGGSFPGSIRTNAVSGNPLTAAALGANDVYQWTLSTDGDRYGSYTSLAADVGNPGVNLVPEPTTIALLLLGAMSWIAGRRGR